MADKITEYLTANDNADEYAVTLLDGLEQDRLEEIDDLLNSTDRRDELLWVELEIDSELTIEDYEEAPTEDRDVNWILGLAGLATAANTQFFLDHRQDTVIKPTAYREQVLDAYSMTRAEIVEAGKRSIEIVDVGQFQSLQSKYVNELSFLSNMDNTELYNALREFEALRPIDQAIADSMDYVSRMTSYKPGTPQFKRAVNDLIDANSERAVKGMNRRSVEQIHSYREADGDLKSLMVWIGEADAKACDFCRINYGEVKTYGEWIADGLPGTDVCRGGDYCRCHLASV